MSMNISRRSFMKGAAASSLAVAASTMLTGCSMPNLGDIFGNLFGGQKGTFTIKGDPKVDVALTGFKLDEYKNVVVTAKFTSKTEGTEVNLAPKASTGYTIVPALTNPDVPAAQYFYFSELSSISVTNGILKAGETAEWKMVFKPGANTALWNSLQLTMTMYNGSSPEGGEPVVFKMNSRV